MFREILAHTDLGAAPTVALCLFVATFVGVVGWSFMRRRGQHFEQMGRLPLDDGEVSSDATGETGGVS